MKLIAVLPALLLPALAPACELCAIYSADNARGDSSSGFVFTLSEQYIPFDKLQYEGSTYSSVPFLEQAFLHSSITHFAPGYNFSPRLAVSLNVPYVHRNFRRTQITPLGEFIDEQGAVSGLGDTALVGRWTVFQKNKMDHSFSVNLLAGVKFPTGDTERLEAEVAEEMRYQSYFGPVHSHAFGGIHQHDLSPGSGSFDGVFGVTANSRWRRMFFNVQAQYYLRTEALGYEYGDLTIVSGGPGVYALLLDTFTLSVQANAFYENQNSDEVLGKVNNQTGLTSWYVGPQISLTWGEHFSANAGADLPVRIYNRGIQSVPDFRIHAGVSWKF